MKCATRVVVRDVPTSMEPAFSLRSANGALTDVVLLSQQQAESAWKIAADRSKGLLLTSSDFYADNLRVTLQTVGFPDFEFEITPGDRFAIRGNGIVTRITRSILNCAATQPIHHPKLSILKIADAGPVSPARLGPKLSWRDTGVAMAPEDGTFHLAATWDLTLPPDAWQVDNLFLTIHYDGDVARLTSGGKLLADNFYNGTPWTVGLNRFRRQIAEHGLRLQILPRRRDAPVYIESGDASAAKEQTGQILNLGDIDLLAEYQLKFNLSPVN